MNKTTFKLRGMAVAVVTSLSDFWQTDRPEFTGKFVFAPAGQGPRVISKSLAVVTRAARQYVKSHPWANL